MATNNNYFDKNFGGVNNYAQSQNQRYAQAHQSNDVDLQNRLRADAQRVGYTLNSPQQPTPQANPSTAPVNFDQYRTQNATINDISQKYGFDFSRENAARQANAEAQAKRDAANQGKRAVDSRVEGSADALDRNYFQQYMQQAQGQANSGLNSGIAADQDLRMAMARQANMGDIYRDANLEHGRLDDALGRVELERLAREDGLHFDRTMAGAGLAQNLDGLNMQQNLAMMQGALQQRGQNIGMDQFDRSFNYQQGRDNVMDGRWLDQFNYGKERDNRSDFESDRNFGFMERTDSRDYDRRVFENDRGFDWGQETYWNDFNNLSAYQKQALAAQRASGGGGSQNYSKMYEDLLMKLFGQEKEAEMNRINNMSTGITSQQGIPSNRNINYRPQW